MTNNNLSGGKIEDRLEACRTYLNLSKSDFSISLGLNPQEYSKYFTEKKTKRNPSLLVENIISLGISADWYLTGVGEMLLKNIERRLPEAKRYEEAGRYLEMAVNALKGE